MSARSTAMRWLREPLAQFLVAGVALFAAWHALHPDQARDTVRIELTQDDLRQMTVGWLAQGRPAPSPEQMRSLVENKVREEILYREALALGLDRDDTIIKRRLAQKMEFLANDTASVRDPSPGELKAWFAENNARFVVPPRVTFRHVYFSFDRRGENARRDAAGALKATSAEGSQRPSPLSIGDASMFQDRFTDRTPEQLAAIFGPTFVEGLFRATPGSWQGPIESGYGWHLVLIDAMEPARAPPYEEAESAIRDAWMSEQREASKRRAFDTMRKRYEVVLPEETPKLATSTATANQSR